MKKGACFCGIFGQKGELTTLVSIGSLIVIVAVSAIMNFFSNKTNQSLKTKAVLNTPICKKANLDWTPCTISGEWCVVCTGNSGPCNRETEGVALPYQCESIDGKLTWNLKNINGECNGACKTGSATQPTIPASGCTDNYLCDTRKSGQEMGCGGNCDPIINPNCSKGMCNQSINFGCGYGGCRPNEVCINRQCLWENSPGYDAGLACGPKSLESLKVCTGGLQASPTQSSTQPPTSTPTQPTAGQPTQLPSDCQNYLCDTRKSGQEMGCGGNCDTTVNPNCSKGMCDPQMNSGCGYGGCRSWEYCDLYEGNYVCYWEQTPGYDSSKSCGGKSSIPFSPCQGQQPTLTPVIINSPTPTQYISPPTDIPTNIPSSTPSFTPTVTPTAAPTQIIDNPTDIPIQTPVPTETPTPTLTLTSMPTATITPLTTIAPTAVPIPTSVNPPEPTPNSPAQNTAMEKIYDKAYELYAYTKYPESRIIPWKGGSLKIDICTTEPCTDYTACKKIPDKTCYEAESDAIYDIDGRKCGTAYNGAVCTDLVLMANNDAGFPMIDPENLRNGLVMLAFYQSNSNFIFYPNGNNQIPRRGDTVFFGNPPSHVAIADQVTSQWIKFIQYNSRKCFTLGARMDQNNKYYIDNLNDGRLTLGWGRPKL